MLDHNIFTTTSYSNATISIAREGERERKREREREMPNIESDCVSKSWGRRGLE